MTSLTKSRSILMLLMALMAMVASAQVPDEAYIKHYSGNVLSIASGTRTAIVSPTDPSVKKVKFIKQSDGSYAIAYDNNGTTLYMSLDGGWNTSWKSDVTSANAHYEVISANDNFYKFKCKANGKYLGTDASTAGSFCYSDKDGGSSLHLWYLTQTANEVLETPKRTYIVNPASLRQPLEGWGVSLCWWAGQCGNWSDEKIDQIVDWLVSLEGLNFNIFRYNIGGGDDPLNRHCDPHHMGRGKGLRAEMEGFKDSSDDDYHWDRDAAQRKIMLKIKERRPDAIFEAFSNSCPYYMTYSGCVSGNEPGSSDNLRPEYYEEFAHYLVDVCKHYKDVYGIEFKTLEPFNESATGFWYRNGPQEGCHFDVSSQVKFIKTLAPILKASGLNTVISASDETDAGLTVNDLNEFKNAGIMDLIGQVNTHTYSASTKSRSQTGSLGRDAGKTVWMSEVGSGGSGIQGNLNMAQRLFDDVRYILPSAWIDWQYIEELNDQWCMVRGSFADQTYYKVKNYYVRQQVTRFIKQGYTFVNSLSANTLAAVNADRDTLVLVTLNADTRKTDHVAQLMGGQVDVSKVKAYQTTNSLNIAAFKSFTIDENQQLTFSMPELSIITFIIPLQSPVKVDMSIKAGDTYLIQPQGNGEMALTCKKGGKLCIDTATGDAAQRWTLEEKGTGFILKNGEGIMLATPQSYDIPTTTNASVALSLKIQPVEDYFYRIMTTSTKGLDLSNESTAAGTQVGSWEYGNSVSAYHRNWSFVKVASAQSEDNVAVQDIKSSQSPIEAIYDLTGRRLSSLQPGVNIIKSNGKTKKVYMR